MIGCVGVGVGVCVGVTEREIERAKEKDNEMGGVKNITTKRNRAHFWHKLHQN